LVMTTVMTTNTTSATTTTPTTPSNRNSNATIRNTHCNFRSDKNIHHPWQQHNGQLFNTATSRPTNQQQQQQLHPHINNNNNNCIHTSTTTSTSIWLLSPPTRVRACVQGCGEQCVQAEGGGGAVDGKGIKRSVLSFFPTVSVVQCPFCTSLLCHLCNVVCVVLICLSLQVVECFAASTDPDAEEGEEEMLLKQYQASIGNVTLFGCFFVALYLSLFPPLLPSLFVSCVSLCLAGLLVAVSSLFLFHRKVTNVQYRNCSWVLLQGITPQRHGTAHKRVWLVW